MGNATTVRVNIEPSDNNGHATWVRALDGSGRVWWKWYGSEFDAYDDAEKLGLAFIETFAGSQPELQNVRRKLKDGASIDPDQLIYFRFQLLSEAAGK